jgi:hypothetical protein
MDSIEEVTVFRKQYVAQRIWAYDPTSGTSDAIIARFPQRHYCQYCQEEIIHAFGVDRYPGAFLRDVDGAIRAADHGCSLYEWLLDFVIRSRAPEDLVGEEGLFLQRQSLPKKPDDVYSVQFLIGTSKYSWPCVGFDVFTESGQSPEDLIRDPNGKKAKSLRQHSGALHKHKTIQW